MNALLPSSSSGSWSPALSPDGRHAAYVSDRDGRPRVWVSASSIDTGSIDSGVVGAGMVGGRVIDTGLSPVTGVAWSSCGEWLAVQVAPGGAPRHEVWLVRPDGAALRQVAGFGSSTADNMRWLPGRSQVAGRSPLAGRSQSASRSSLPGRSSLADRSLLTVTENLTDCLVIDPDGARTVACSDTLVSLLDVSGTRALLRYGPRGERYVVIRDLLTGESTFVAHGEQAFFAAGGVLVRAESDELPCLLSWTPEGTKVLASSTRDELESFAVTADGHRAALLWNVYGGTSRIEIADLDTLSRRPVDPLPGLVAAGLTWSLDGSALAFTAEGPGRPHGVWAVRPSPPNPGGTSGLPFVPESGSPSVPEPGSPSMPEPGFPSALESAKSDLSPVPVSASPADESAVVPSLETFTAHDGLTLTGWLFRPRTDGPHPAVIWLHGGPEAQERPGHGPLFQSLTARGIAVFAPNVRGSSGFGRTFVNADNGPSRHAAIRDVESAVQFLVSAGFARRDLIGCMGRSYGGYLTLAALTTFPDLFAVGIDICGMSDFATFYAHTEPWIAAAAVSKYGDPLTDSALLADLSPMTRIDRLRAPLLIVHGENDSNVPLIEATQVAAALAARHHPHKLLLFPDEGHDFLHRDARETYVAETVSWLTTHLRPAA